MNGPVAPTFPWPELPLRRIGKIVNGGTPRAESGLWDGEVPFVTPPDLRPVVGSVVTRTERTLTDEGVRSGSSIVPAGSVLLSIRAPIGYVARTSTVAAFNQGCRAIVPSDKHDARFVTYALMMKGDFLDSIGRGTTFMEVSTSQMAEVRIPTPPLDEQQAISDYLDSETRRIDELIVEQRDLIETLRERRRGATFWLLSGLDVGGDRWSSDSFVFPSLPAGWGTVALGKIGDSKSGSGFPPAHQGKQGGELQFYKVKHLGLADSADVINGADDTISRGTAFSLRAHVFPAGTIVYAKVGAALMLGRIRTLGVEGCIDNNMAGFTPFDVADSRYVQLAMSAIPFDYLVNPGAVPSLSDKKLMALKIPFPSARVRRAIARSIDDQTSRIDALIAESEDLIALSQERRAALITAAVTGQIDVRQAA